MERQLTGTSSPLPLIPDPTRTVLLEHRHSASSCSKTAVRRILEFLAVGSGP